METDWLGFQHREEAEIVLRDLQERLRKFGLELNPEKTRLIEFGRYAAVGRAKRGEGKPETFHFLGFHGVPENRPQADGGNPEHGEVAASGGSRLFPAHMVMAASTAESKNPLDVGAFSGETRPSPPCSRDSASLPRLP